MNGMLITDTFSFHMPKVFAGEHAFARLVSKMRFTTNPVKNRFIFYEWCRQSVSRRLKTDKEFAARVKVRNLRRRHAEMLYSLEDELRVRTREWTMLPESINMQKLEKKLEGAQNAVSNMQRVLAVHKENPARTEKDDKAMGKIGRIGILLPVKNQEILRIKEEMERVRLATPTLQVLEDTQQRLQALLDELGLTEAMQQVSSTVREAGNNCYRRGVSFEEICEHVVRENLLTEVAAREGRDASSLFLIRNVKFGFAAKQGCTAEFDMLICAKRKVDDTMPLPETVQIPRESYFCDVLGVVEVKRNADDIGQAFCSYQEPLLWLCGVQSRYDSSTFSSRVYKDGHFTYCVLDHSGETLVLSKESFASILPRDEHEREVAPFLFKDKIYFITKDTQLEGMSSSLQARALYQLSTSDTISDELSEDDEASMDRIRLNLIAKYPHMGKTLCTCELLDMYQRDGLLKQIFVIGKEDTS